MSFVSTLNTGQLPEKPWQTGAVARLGVSVVIGILIGAVVTMVIQYFGIPQTSSVSEFLLLATVAFASYVAAIVILSRPWPADPKVARLIILLALVYLGFFFTWAAGRFIKGNTELRNPVVAMLIAVLAFQGLTLVLIPFFLRQHDTGWFEGFGLDRQPVQSLLIGIGIGALVLWPVLSLNDLCFHLFERLTLHPQEQQTVEILRHADTLLGRAVSGIATVLIAPIGEEIIFRGILYPWVKRKFSQTVALWGTAVLFGAIHANLSSFVPLTLLALILVGLYEYTGNLLAPIAVHFVFNGANFVALFYQQNSLPHAP
jgi:uncharacterized protein